MAPPMLRCFTTGLSGGRGSRPLHGWLSHGDPMSTSVRSLRRVTHAFAVVALVAVAACHRTQPGTDLGEPDGSQEPATIEFTNESLSQADVFVIASGNDRRRIGTVFAGRTETLTIPRELAIRGSVTIVARLLARSRAPSTGSMAIGPGTRLSIRLPLDEKTLYVLPAR